MGAAGVSADMALQGIMPWWWGRTALVVIVPKGSIVGGAYPAAYSKEAVL